MSAPQPHIRPAAKFTQRGWISLGAGLVLLLIVSPATFFWSLAAGFSNGVNGDPQAFNWPGLFFQVALWLGLAGAVAGIVLLIVGSVKNARNREAAQAAQVSGYSSDSNR